MNFKFNLILILALNLSFLVVVNCWPNFNFYHGNSTENYTFIDPDNHLLNSVQINLAKKTVFLVHGFSDNALETKLQKAKNEYLKKEDVNLIMVDWKEGAEAPNYVKASKNVKACGQKLAKFVQDFGIDPKKVHCVGHSLGAHVCGFAGKITKFKRITGLDPAGPGFKFMPASERLDKTDADFVDNIHVDLVLGIQTAIGHKDFYPNGGKHQPGCSFGIGKIDLPEIFNLNFIETHLNPIPVIACSHLKVPFYFSESINSDCKFRAVPCENYDKFKKGFCKCPASGCPIMGYLADQDNLTGQFYLDTNRDEPFCQN